MDFLADKGVPVYSIIDPLEERGIPAFPVAIGSVALILFLLYGFVFLSAPASNVTLSFSDSSGQKLGGVTILPAAI